MNVASEEIQDLCDVADRFDAIIFDQFGVLVDGVTAIDWARVATAHLKAKGKTLAVLTNSGKRERENRDRLTRLGFPADTFKRVMSSGEALWEEFSSGDINARSIFPIEAKSGDAQIWGQSLNLTFVDSIDAAEAVLLMGLPEGTDGIAQRALLQQARKRNLTVLCSNPDRASPRPGAVLQLSPGQLAHEYLEAGGTALFWGKPHARIFQHLATALNARPDRLLMVGDSMHHDIKGAQAAGFKSVFVRSGLTDKHFEAGTMHENLASLAQEANCRVPDYVLMPANARLQRPPASFFALSTRCGSDPLQVQGPGGNTSFKHGNAMWIKASGTELSHAESKSIFVAVDRAKAKEEVEGEGDGTCRKALLDPADRLRPSIETTFHALIDWPVVVHTHSVATLVHATSPEGLEIAREKLAGLPFTIIPYRKPGLPLTQAIAGKLKPDTRVFILANHGLIVCGETVEATDQLLHEVEQCLQMSPMSTLPQEPTVTPPEAYVWHVPATLLATNSRLHRLATSGSYYPDHVVFLGPALPVQPSLDSPAVLVPGVGVALRKDAKSAAAQMLTCLADVLQRIPRQWSLAPIGQAAEQELLNWDAEKYRQALAKGKLN